MNFLKKKQEEKDTENNTEKYAKRNENKYLRRSLEIGQYNKQIAKCLQTENDVGNFFLIKEVENKNSRKTLYKKYLKRMEKEYSDMSRTFEVSIEALSEQNIIEIEDIILEHILDHINNHNLWLIQLY